MRKSPSVFLLIFVIGVPGAVVLAMLWPQIHNGIADDRENDSLEVVHQQEVISQSEVVSQSENDETAATELRDDDPDTERVVPVAPQQQVAPRPSAVDQAVAANREKLQAARVSYEHLLQTIGPDLLQTYGAQEWRTVLALVSQAEQLPQPLAAAGKYAEAEASLKVLRSDLPNRQLLGELTELQTQEPMPFLARLAEVSTSQPAMRELLSPFWADVLNWDTQKWLAVVQRECENLSPDDGGFADVYHALADFHRQSGSGQAAVDAEQTSWDNAIRMTNAKRAAESALRSLQRLADSTPASTRASRIEEVTKLVRDVADIHERLKLLAEMACLSPQSQAQSLLMEIHDLAVQSRIDLRLYWPLIYRCRVLAEIRSPSDVFAACKSIPKYNGMIGYDPFPANTMGYAHAASAAARTNQQSDFWKAMLLAEAQQLDSTGVDLRDQRACAVLASADLRQANFRRVVFSAMNLRERSLRPPLLFPVMKDAPQNVPSSVAEPLIRRNGMDDLGCVAVAAYLPTLAGSFESEPELMSWILGLKPGSVRSAALIGFARHRLSPLTAIPTRLAQQPPLDLPDPRSLLENARADAALLQLPLERAWAHLWIAACWNRLNQPASYADALTDFDDAMYSVWKSHWQNSDDNGDSTSSYRRNQQRDKQLNDIIECYSTAAELQAFALNDPRRAIENIINAARTSQPLNDDNAILKIRLWMIADTIHRDCDIPAGTLDSVILPPNDYYRMLLAARQGDLGEVTRLIQKIETEGLGPDYRAPDFLARAYAELAILSAKNGDTEAYRSLRRKAAGIITSRGAVDSLFLPLHEADAFAGEFALAMNRKPNYSKLPLYGTSGRTASALCCQLSLASRTDDAIKHLPSTSEPFYRLQAMHAVAASRSDSTDSEELLRWLDEQTEPLDRIAILCGLAYRKPIQ
ncbi:hypothetical protein GC176_02130 [bacterium]|nr:hypothetical protein [bacterium]